jgi:hypothetical protein
VQPPLTLWHSALAVGCVPVFCKLAWYDKKEHIIHSFLPFHPYIFTKFRCGCVVASEMLWVGRPIIWTLGLVGLDTRPNGPTPHGRSSCSIKYPHKKPRMPPSSDPSDLINSLLSYPLISLFHRRFSLHGVADGKAAVCRRCGSLTSNAVSCDCLLQPVWLSGFALRLHPRPYTP